MAFFFVFAVQYIFFQSFFLLFLESICLIFKQKNADNSTIYKYSKLLSHSTGIGLFFSVCGLRTVIPCVSLWFFSLFFIFDNFFQVSFFRFFVCIWKDRRSWVFFWSSLLSISLIYYFVMWVEFTYFELFVTKPEWNFTLRLCGLLTSRFGRGLKSNICFINDESTRFRSRNVFARSFKSSANHSLLCFTSNSFEGFLKHCSWWRQRKASRNVLRELLKAIVLNLPSPPQNSAPN